MLNFQVLKEEGVKKVHRIGHKYLPFRFFIFLPSLLILILIGDDVTDHAAIAAAEGLNLGYY